MVPESAAVRDGILVLPMALAGRDCTGLSAAAFERSDAVWDREAIDALGLRLAMAIVVQERWGELEPAVARLDRAATRGSAVARAVATAARGEMAGKSRAISHHSLRGFRFTGLSDILAFRDRMHSGSST